jgi:branched-chain amino acid transport system permease protein
MTRKYRNFFWGLGGVLLITAPFIWCKLRFNYNLGTVETVGALSHGLKFWQGLLSAFGLIAGGWLLYALGRWWKPLAQAWTWGTPRVENLSAQPWWSCTVFFFILALGFVLKAKTLNIAIFVGLYMLLALGLNITIGFTGLLVLGYASFYAFGSYVFAIGQKFVPGTTWWMWLPVACLLGALAGFLVGLPCLRLRGDYLAIVTLGFGESFRELVRNLSPITNGDQGIIIRTEAKIQSLGSLSSLLMTYLIIVTAVFSAVILIQRLYHSRIGRAWIAIREDEIAAAAMGINVVQTKLLAFALSAALASIAGVLYVGLTGFINPEACAFENSVLILAMVILGGLGSIPGVLLGSALLYLIPNLLRDYVPALSDYRLLLFGAIMVVMMLFRPQGLLGSSRHKAELQAE